MAILVVLSGCEAVGGMDINKALLQVATVQSFEGKSVLALDLAPGDEVADSPEAQTMFKLLEHTELHYDSIQMDKAQQISAKGYLIIAKRKIPFQAYVTEKQFIIALEGAKKPIVINQTSASSGAALPAFVTELQEKLKDGTLLNSLTSFFIRQLPNPAKINIESVRETINGETLSLRRLQGEVTGKELMPLAKTYITQLMKDDKALKEVIGQLYDLLYPVISPHLAQLIKDMEEGKVVYPFGGVRLREPSGSTYEEELDYEDENHDSLLPGNEQGSLGSEEKAGLQSFIGIMDMLKNRDMTIEVIHTEVKQLFVFALVGLHALNKEQLQEMPIFSDTTYMKADLYVDADLQLRKSSLLLEAISLNKATNGRISSAKLGITSEYWNINNPVKAIQMNVDGGALILEQGLTPFDVIGNFSPASEAFRLLKDDWGIGKKSFVILMDADRYKPNSQKPFLEDDVTMVSTSFLSDKLDLRIDWNEQAQAVTVTDPLTLKSIQLKSGSRTALVDGVDIQMDKEMLLRDGVNFVPLTFIVTQLGGTTQWDSEARSIKVTK